MKKQALRAVVICVSLLTGSLSHAAGGGHRLGVAANYWKAVNDFDISEIDKNGVSWLASYQYVPGTALSFEADVEMFKKGFAGSTEAVYAPQAYILLGSTIYAGAGMGIYYSDGDFANRPFYALRAGLELELIPRIFLDINANYRFNEWKNISQLTDDIKSDTITLGAALRLAF